MSEKNKTKKCGLRATIQPCGLRATTNKRGLSATTKNIIYNNYNMKRQDLSNLNKDQLIDLLLKQNTKI